MDLLLLVGPLFAPLLVYNSYTIIWGFSWWLRGKESSFQCRRCGFDPWIGKIPWRRRKWQPTPVFLPGNFHGPEEPGGLQSMGVTELDTTEHTHTLSFGVLVMWSTYERLKRCLSWVCVGRITPLQAILLDRFVHPKDSWLCPLLWSTPRT